MNAKKITILFILITGHASYLLAMEGQGSASEPIARRLSLRASDELKKLKRKNSGRMSPGFCVVNERDALVSPRGMGHILLARSLEALCLEQTSTQTVQVEEALQVEQQEDTE